MSKKRNSIAKKEIGWFILDGKPTKGEKKDRHSDRITVAYGPNDKKRVANWFKTRDEARDAKRLMVVPDRIKPAKKKVCAKAKQAPVSVRRDKHTKKEVKEAIKKVVSKGQKVFLSKGRNPVVAFTGWFVKDGQVMSGKYAGHDDTYVFFDALIGRVKVLNWYRTREGARNSIRKSHR